MNEINKLIWPSPDGRGRHRPGGVGPDGRDRAEHAEPGRHDRAHRRPDAGAYTNDYVNKALANLKDLGVDTTGASYQPTEVTLNEGGA